MEKTAKTLETPLKLDLFDKRLLYELDKNARQPTARLAKRAGVSQQVADYRLKRFEKSGLIKKFVALVEYRKLGYSNYSLLLRFQGADERKTREITAFLQKHPSVNVLIRMTGRWDVFASLCARDIFELNEIVSDIEARWSAHIRDTAKAVHIGRRYFYRHYLVPEKERAVQEYTPITGGEAPERFDLDEADSKILLALDQNARASVVEIARATGLSADSVYHRLRRLLKERVIVGTMTWLNPALLGRSYCRLFLKTRNLTRERERELAEFVSNSAITFGLIKAFGAWDYCVETEAESVKEFSDFSLSLRNEFGDAIVEFEAPIACEMTKFTVVPQDLLEKFRK